MVKDLGVKIETGRSLSTKDLTIDDLLASGAEAIFVGIGLPEPKRNSIFAGLTETMGYYTSKSFLPRISEASKPGMCPCKSAGLIPQLNGIVVVLGAGDTAFDCATGALRCGARKVFVVFRRGFSNIRAVPEEVSLAVEEKCELIGFMSPYKVNLKGGKVHSVTFLRTEETEDGKWIEDVEQQVTIKTNYVISAFGSGLYDENGNHHHRGVPRYRSCFDVFCSCTSFISTFVDRFQFTEDRSQHHAFLSSRRILRRRPGRRCRDNSGSGQRRQNGRLVYALPSRRSSAYDSTQTSPLPHCHR